MKCTCTMTGIGFKVEWVCIFLRNWYCDQNAEKSKTNFYSIGTQMLETLEAKKNKIIARYH